ncbi:unnamed protein product [Rhizophagus irregularis]|nr:unnamed protein product [Rhizophagus irregularis]
MVTDLDAETDSDQSEDENNPSLEIPREIQKTLKKIPNELLAPRTENPVRALVFISTTSFGCLKNPSHREANHG